MEFYEGNLIDFSTKEENIGKDIENCINTIIKRVEEKLYDTYTQKQCKVTSDEFGKKEEFIGVIKDIWLYNDWHWEIHCDIISDERGFMSDMVVNQIEILEEL
jgi:hypothetical protein